MDSVPSALCKRERERGRERGREREGEGGREGGREGGSVCRFLACFGLEREREAETLLLAKPSTYRSERIRVCNTECGYAMAEAEPAHLGHGPCTKLRRAHV